MLESTLKEQLKGIFAGLNANYTFDISISPAYESRQELLDLLGDVASCSDKISMQVSDGEGLEFILLKDGAKTGIKFRGVPNGHILPRKAEAAEQGLKRRDSRMVRKVVAGLAECGKRTAEAVIEGVPRGPNHDAFPFPGPREGLFRVLSDTAPDSPCAFHRDGAQRHEGT